MLLQGGTIDVQVFIPIPISMGFAVTGRTLSLNNLRGKSRQMLSSPIFFMHIAKTAGSYVNEVFRTSCGDGAVILHAESKIGSGQDLNCALEDGKVFISGHIMYGLWCQIQKPEANFYKFTVVRDPIEHIVSHILWLDHYNLPQLHNEFKRLDEQHRRMVELIGQTDLNDPRMLDDLITNLPAIGIRLLDNCQARYFLPMLQRGVSAVSPLSLACVPQLRKSMSEFNAILRQDAIIEGLAEVSKDIGFDLVTSDERVNEAKSPRTINFQNPLIRHILGKRTTVDQWLWRHLSRPRTWK